MEEIEVKFLDIDVKDIEKRLKKIGAKKVFDRIFKSRVFDYPDLRLNGEAAWIRLRDEGDKITLSFKKRVGTKDLGENDDGMIEHEIIVSDFEATSQIFFSAGFIQKFYEEKRRIRYMYKKIEFDIDFVPALKPYLEIEANTWGDIDKVIGVMGLDPKDKKIFSTFQIYKLNGIDMLDYSEMTLERLVKRK